MLSSVSNVLLALLISCHLLLATARSRLDQLAILIRYIVRIARLQLVVEGEEKLDVPGEDNALCRAGEHQLLPRLLDIAKAALQARHMERS